MKDRHPLLRAASLVLPLLLIIAACTFFALSASSRYPNGELRIMPSPVAGISGGNHVALEPITSIRLEESVLNFNVNGPVLYAAITRAGLATLDISDLENPVVMDHVTLEAPSNPRDVNQYVLNAFPVGERLILLDRVRGLSVYDASDPYHPTFLWSKLLPGPPGEQAIDLEHIGDYIYLACGGGGLVQLPAALTPEAEPRYLLNRFDHTTDTAFMEPNWLLATDGRTGGLQIVGLENPEEPRPLGNITTWPLYMQHIVVQGKHVFASTRGDNVMVAFNLTHPATPYISNFFRQRALRIRTIAGWKDRYILLSNDFGLIEIFDTIDAESPKMVSLIPLEGKVSAMFVRDDILYAAIWGKRRVEIFRLIEDESLIAASVVQS